MRNWQPGALGDAHASLNGALGLPASGAEQDWDIELADGGRLSEFIRFYRERRLSDAERHELLGLIVASYHLRAEEGARDRSMERGIAKLVAADPGLFVDIVKYWTEFDVEFSRPLFTASKALHG